jgi:hypothetical protein
MYVRQRFLQRLLAALRGTLSPIFAIFCKRVVLMLWHASLLLGLRHVEFSHLFPFDWLCALLFLVKNINFVIFTSERNTLHHRRNNEHSAAPLAYLSLSLWLATIRQT